MSQFNNPRFKKLQKAWYAKIAKKGFEDIEDVDSPREMLKRWHGSWFKSRMTPDLFKAKEIYFQNAAWFLNMHIFETTLEKNIWRAHADGLSLQETAVLLGCTKSKAFLIVNKLKKVLNGNRG